MENATWVAVAMATVSLLGNVVNAINGRKAATEKAESERLAAKDKMEFDLKMKAIEVDQLVRKAELATVHTKLTRVEAELGDCRKQHEASEADRVELRSRAEKAETAITAQAAELADLRQRVSHYTNT